MTNLHRKGEGQPLRTAMERAGLSGPKLAAETRRVDPEGRGISAAAVGRVAGRGKTARNECRLRTAWLIADALGQPLQDLFRMPSPSTPTVERLNSSDAEEE
ncbi:hypothetical protein [Streptomyces acidiscabies]|uniref:XRE family transcriptional regulator n=1 Tax=Streptomyces acidiscabies TaxID=42234 RepID=A0AAP6BL04_9ACTN|nr:hypothetical protein [Streptomyces acidiscabies]MBZ3909386.1 XRE family transcriptional regulator [Streptomyces acidiscabies]MDX2966615.1 XRE family transcriptional regulator [Streptomyces acidiscabies]MDX3019923.1 XRE family transcriptional regulator [Streptomyces acidiscabies]MDX3796585.1 XRE family transcriptional regulator [Streptomyces acidiscabies]